MKNLIKTFLLIIIGISIAGCSDPEIIEKEVLVEVEKEVPIPGTPSSLNPSGTGQPINGTISFLSANKVASTYYTFIMGGSSSKTSSSNETYNLTSTSFTYFDLGYGTTYYYWVTAHNDKGSSDTSSSSFKTRVESAGPVVIVGKPHTPTPATGLTNVPTRGTLSFVKGDNTPSNATFRISITKRRGSTRTNVVSGQDIGVNTNYTYSFENSYVYFWSIETYRGRTLLATSATWSFTTVELAALVPHTPTPSSGLINVPTRGTLSFVKSDNTPSNATFGLQITSRNFSSPLTTSNSRNLRRNTNSSYTGSNSTTYYWRIGVFSGSTLLATSPTWFFTTKAAPVVPPVPSYIPTSPYPSSRATGVSRSGALSFTKHADAPNNVNYVLHFGTSSTFTTTTTVTYGLGTANSHVYSLNGLNSLTANTRYYWRVFAYQNGRLLGNSSTWYFTTGTN